MARATGFWALADARAWWWRPSATLSARYASTDAEGIELLLRELAAADPEGVVRLGVEAAAMV